MGRTFFLTRIVVPPVSCDVPFDGYHDRFKLPPTEAISTPTLLDGWEVFHKAIASLPAFSQCGSDAQPVSPTVRRIYSLVPYHGDFGHENDLMGVTSIVHRVNLTKIFLGLEIEDLRRYKKWNPVVIWYRCEERVMAGYHDCCLWTSNFKLIQRYLRRHDIHI